MLKINSHRLSIKLFFLNISIVDDSFEILIRDNVDGNDNPSTIKYFPLLQRLKEITYYTLKNKANWMKPEVGYFDFSVKFLMA